MFVQALPERVKVDLEVLHGRRHNHGLCARAALDEHQVFREVRRQYCDLVPRAGHGLERTGQRRRRTYGQVQAVARIRGAETAVQVVRQRRAHIRCALRRGIAVQRDRIASSLLQNRLPHRVRRGYVRIAERKVEYILTAYHRSALVAVFKKLTDGRAVVAQRGHTLVYHQETSPFCCDLL